MPTQTFHNLPQQKRGAIIEVALDEFSSHTYRQASLTRMVKTLGIAKGSMYQYFADKKELYCYIVELATQAHMEYLAEPRLDPGELGFFQYLRQLLQLKTSFELHYPREAKILYNAFYGDVPFKEELVGDMVEASQAMLKNLLAGAKGRGELRPDVDLELATFVFSTLSLEFGKYALTRLNIEPEELYQKKGSDAARAAEREIEDMFGSLLDILANGLAKRLE